MKKLLDVEDLANYLKLRKQTIYNWLNQEKIDAYLDRWRQHYEAGWQQQRRNPPSHVKRLLEIKAKHEASKHQVERSHIPRIGEVAH